MNDIFNFLVASAFVKLCSFFYLSKRWKKVNVGKITELRFYPIKSCRGFNVDYLECVKEGCVYQSLYDRQFVVIDHEGRMVTGRNRPKMLLIAPKFHENVLTLDAPNMETFHLKLPIVTKSSSSVNVFVLSRDVKGVDCGDEIAQWLSEYLESPGLRLICNEHQEGKLRYQDESALSLITEQSINDVNNHLDQPISITRFRSSIIVKTDKPYAEDSWSNLFIHNVWLQLLWPTERCLMTTVDPESGVRDDALEPLTTLKKFRILPGHKKPCLAVSLSVMKSGRLSVGDDIFATLN